MLLCIMIRRATKARLARPAAEIVGLGMMASRVLYESAQETEGPER
jgi:hypothetical protein